MIHPIGTALLGLTFCGAGADVVVPPGVVLDGGSVGPVRGRVVRASRCCGTRLVMLVMGSRRRRLQAIEGLRSGDPVNLQVPRRLIPPDRLLSQRPVPAVEAPGREPSSRQCSLQTTDRLRTSGVTLTGIHDGPGRGQRGQRQRPGDAIDPKTMRSLEGDHRVLCQRSVPTVHGARRVTKADQPTLERFHRTRAVVGLVAGARGEHLGARALATTGMRWV